jgi:hypothetical protein
MSRNHDLKTIQPYFDDIVAGRKTFEMRLNDRQFQPGDTVTLREFNPAGACKNLHEKPEHGGDRPGPNCQYTGRVVRKFRIGYVLSAAPGVPLGDYVVFSLEPLS